MIGYGLEVDKLGSLETDISSKQAEIKFKELPTISPKKFHRVNDINSGVFN